MSWIYRNDVSDENRYIIGEEGDHPFICFGINPSYATPDHIDPTIRQIRNLSRIHEKSGWTMFNVYPQRSTDPNGLSPTKSPRPAELNLEVIEEFLSRHKKADVFAGWGNNISLRPYLIDCLKDIHEIVTRQGCSWKAIGGFSRNGNPWHPRFLFIQHNQNPQMGLLSKIFSFDVKGTYGF